MNDRTTPFRRPAGQRCSHSNGRLSTWLPASRFIDERRYGQGIGILGVCCLHLLFFLALQALLRSEPGLPSVASAIQARLIDDSIAPPVASVLPAPALNRETSRVQRTIGREKSQTRQGQAVTPRLDRRRPAPTRRARSPDLFDSAGRVVLPDPAPVEPTDPFSTTRQAPEFASNPLDHLDALPYRSTRFNRRWVPEGETLGGAFVRNGTFEKHWDTRGGNRIQCVVVVILPACLWGWIPRAPIGQLQAMRADPPKPRTRP